MHSLHPVVKWSGRTTFFIIPVLSPGAGPALICGVANPKAALIRSVTYTPIHLHGTPGLLSPVESPTSEMHFRGVSPTQHSPIPGLHSLTPGCIHSTQGCTHSPQGCTYSTQGCTRSPWAAITHPRAAITHPSAALNQVVDQLTATPTR